MEIEFEAEEDILARITGAKILNKGEQNEDS